MVNTFATKTAAIEHYHDLLHRLPLGPVPEAYTPELLQLMGGHPSAAAKMGCGVVSFTIQDNKPGGYRGFYAVRADGSVVDFLYAKCIAAPVPPLGYLLRVLRSEVHADIARAKERYYDQYADASRRVPCAVSGISMSSNEAIADHVLPASFHMLGTCFVTALRIRPEDVGYIYGCNGVPTYLADRGVACWFREYHRDTAHIRLVTSTVNGATAQQAKPSPKHRQLMLDASS